MNHAKCYVPGYPRIQFVRKSFLALNGTWDFTFLNDDITSYDIDKIDFDKKIKVPYAYQSPLSTIGDTTYHKCVGYRKVFNYTRTEGKDLLLHLEAVDYEAFVYLNGKYLGSHKGGYTRFSFDITKEVKEGENELIVLVKDGIEADKMRGKQSWMKKPWGCWYTETTGIWRSVWMEEVSHTRLSSMRADPIKERDALRFEYEIENYVKGITLEIHIECASQEIADVVLSPKSEHGDIEISLRNEFEAFKVQQWSCEYPNIFDLSYDIKDKDGNLLDHVESYSAYKSFEAKGSLLYLNNNPFFLKMILFQGYYRNLGLTPETESEYEKVVTLCKEIGLNGIRMHQKLESELFYYYCDMMGIMTFLEIPSAYEFSSRTIEDASHPLIEALKQYSNHPSIVAYVPLNESWGVPHISTSVPEMHLASSLYYLAKSYDPNRLVIDNDGWEHVETTDMMTIHNYEQDPKRMKELYDDFASVLKDQNQTMNCRALNDKGCQYKGQPVLLDEFVGTSYSGSNGWGYGSTVNDDCQYETRIRGLISAARNHPYFAGYCITQFNDTYQETNGLFDKDYNPKLPLEVFKSIIQS